MTASRPRDTARIMLTSEADRRRAFARAKQHSRHVRVLKIALPLAALTSAGILILTPSMGLRFSGRNGSGSVAAVQITGDQLRMINPRFDGFTADKGHYVVTAAAAVQSTSTIDEMTLETVHGHLVQADNSWTDLKAKAGTYQVKTHVLRLSDGIDIVTSGNAHAQLASADIDIDTKTVTSDAAVTLGMPNGVIKGRGLLIENESKRIVLRKAVQAHLLPPPGTDASRVSAVPASAISAAPTMSNAPIDISANALEVLDTARTAKFIGAVQAIQAGMTLHADRLEIGYAAGPGADGSTAATARDITTATALDHVVIVTADGRKAMCDQSRFDRKANTMTLLGSVVLTQRDTVLHADQVVSDLTGHKTHVTGKNRISGHFAPDAAGAADGGLAALGSAHSATDIAADTLDISEDNNQALFQGNVVVTQRGNKLTGERLAIDMAQRHMTLTGPGRVTGLFEATAAPAGGAKATLASSPGDTAPTGLGHSLTGLSASNGLPTSIEADSMTVEDERGQATFTGEVLVVRGGHRISADMLTVFYAGGGAGSRQAAQLSRIAARSHVVVHTPDDETASSDALLYDAGRNQLLMTGNVTVSQAGNVIHGDKLVVDLTTGESHFETRPDNTGAQQPGEGPKTGRIQVLITPQGIKQIGGPKVAGTAGRPKPPGKAKSAISASDVLVAPDAPQ